MIVLPREGGVKAFEGLITLMDCGAQARKRKKSGCGEKGVKFSIR